MCAPFVYNPPPPPHTHTLINLPLARCIEMNSTFYDVLELKKAIKLKKSFDQHFYVACFETTFFQFGYQAPPLFIGPPKAPYEVV